jgi:hypothetical protein
MSNTSFPAKLNEVVAFLDEVGIDCCFVHEDGRVNSIADEEKVISILEEQFGTENVERPAVREWWDVKVFGYYLNIKSSDVARKSADNFSSKSAILYALTYLPEDKIKVQKWSEFEEALLNYTDMENDRDYYILVVDKKTGKAHLTSLKSLNKLTSNGNNLPFQIQWADNLVPQSNTFAVAKDLIIGAYKKSVLAKINAHPFVNQL